MTMNIMKRREKLLVRIFLGIDSLLYYLIPIIFYLTNIFHFLQSMDYIDRIYSQMVLYLQYTDFFLIRNPCVWWLNYRIYHHNPYINLYHHKRHNDHISYLDNHNLQLGEMSNIPRIHFQDTQCPPI